MTDEIDVEKLKAYAKLVFGALGGAMTATMIHQGDRLGLYRALADGEALTSAELAARTGCAERWVREWLCQQGAARVLEYRGGGRFALPPEGRAVLADESSPACGVGFFAHFPGMMGIVARLPAMPRPAGTMRHIRAAIRPDGVWLVCDIKARESYEENVEKNPMAAM